MAKKARDDVPATLRRSDRKAQDTYAETRASAESEYHDSGRAARTAWSAVKQAYEKVGDRWKRKAVAGPSDAHAARGGDPADNPAPTDGGIDANASKAHLLELARAADIGGRSSMNKAELVTALREDADQATADARR